MSRRGRRAITAPAALAVLLATLLVVPAVVAGTQPAGAQVPVPAQGTVEDAADAAARVTLAAIDPVVASGTAATWSVVVEHAAEDVWGRVEVVAELHAPLGSRSALRLALAGGTVPRMLQRSVTVAGTGPLRPGAVLRIDGEVPLIGGALSGRDTAVHPLRLRVLADGSEVGRIDTAIVRVGADPSARLATTLVWPLTAPPARGPDGDPARTLDPLTLPGGRLDTLVGALGPFASREPAQAPSRLAAGIALVAPVHLVEDLALRSVDVPDQLVEDFLDGPPAEQPAAADPDALRAALLLQRIRGAAVSLPGRPLSSPYADADLARVLASEPDLRALAARALIEGAGRVPTLLGRDAAPVVLLEAIPPASALDLLPARTVVVHHAALVGPGLALDATLGEPVRTLRSPTGQAVTALVGDPFLELALGASTRAQPGDPVRAAHEVLVRTAMIHLEAPGRPGRALVLLPPEGFDPDPRFAAEVLARLAAAPWLAPMAPQELVATARREGGAPQPAALVEPEDEALPGRVTRALSATARDLELLVGALDPEAGLAGDSAPVGGRLLRDASDELMRATSRAFAGDPEEAVALLAGVRRGVDAAFGTFTLAIDDVTLTDRDGTVPLTLQHAGGVPLRVRVELVGPAALSWTDGRVREVTLGLDTERALEVPVRAGGTGRFPVSVRVTDPSGERLLAEAVVGVRATAVAGPALALIGAVVLALTVIGTFRQRRRGLPWRVTAAGEEVVR